MTIYERAVAGLSRRRADEDRVDAGRRGGRAADPDAPPAGEADLRGLPVLAGCRVRRPAARRHRPVDAAGAEAARRRRHADEHRGGGLGDRARRAVPERRAEGDRARATRARAQRARRGGGPAAGARLLVPLPRRRRGEPDRPDEDRAARRQPRRQAAVRRLRLPALRGRLLHGVPADGRGAVRLRLPHRRLHLRGARRRRPRSTGACGSTSATSSTRSWTIATGTRSTSPIAI